MMDSETARMHANTHFFKVEEGLDEEICELLNQKVQSVTAELVTTIHEQKNKITVQNETIRKYKLLAPKAYDLMELTLEEIFHAISKIHQDSFKVFKSLESSYPKDFFVGVIEDFFGAFFDKDSTAQLKKDVDSMLNEVKTQMNEHIIEFHKEKLKVMKQIDENKQNYDDLKKNFDNQVHQLEKQNQLKVQAALILQEDTFKKHHEEEKKLIIEKANRNKDKYKTLKRLHLKNEARLSFFKWKLVIEAIKYTGAKKKRDIKKLMRILTNDEFQKLKNSLQSRTEKAELFFRLYEHSIKEIKKLRQKYLNEMQKNFDLKLKFDVQQSSYNEQFQYLHQNVVPRLKEIEKINNNQEKEVLSAYQLLARAIIQNNMIEEKYNLKGVKHSANPKQRVVERLINEFQMDKEAIKCLSFQKFKSVLLITPALNMNGQSQITYHGELQSKFEKFQQDEAEEKQMIKQQLVVKKLLKYNQKDAQCQTNLQNIEFEMQLIMPNQVQEIEKLKSEEEKEQDRQKIILNTKECQTYVDYEGWNELQESYNMYYQLMNEDKYEQLRIDCQLLNQNVQIKKKKRKQQDTAGSQENIYSENSQKRSPQKRRRRKILADQNSQQQSENVSDDYYDDQEDSFFVQKEKKKQKGSDDSDENEKNLMEMMEKFNKEKEKFEQQNQFLNSMNKYERFDRLKFLYELNIEIVEQLKKDNPQLYRDTLQNLKIEALKKGAEDKNIILKSYEENQNIWYENLLEKTGSQLKLLYPKNQPEVFQRLSNIVDKKENDSQRTKIFSPDTIHHSSKQFQLQTNRLLQSNFDFKPKNINLQKRKSRQKGTIIIQNNAQEDLRIYLNLKNKQHRQIQSARSQSFRHSFIRVKVNHQNFVEKIDCKNNSNKASKHHNFEIIEENKAQVLQGQKVVLQKKEETQKVKNQMAIENLQRTIGLQKEENFVQAQKQVKIQENNTFTDNQTYNADLTDTNVLSEAEMKILQTKQILSNDKSNNQVFYVPNHYSNDQIGLQKKSSNQLVSVFNKFQKKPDTESNSNKNLKRISQIIQLDNEIDLRNSKVVQANQNTEREKSKQNNDQLLDQEIKQRQSPQLEEKNNLMLPNLLKFNKRIPSIQIRNQQQLQQNDSNQNQNNIGSEISSPYGARTSARSNIVDNIQSNIIAVPIYGSINQDSKTTDSNAIQNLDIKQYHPEYPDNIHELFKQPIGSQNNQLFKKNDKTLNKNNLHINTKLDYKLHTQKSNIEILDFDKRPQEQKILKEPIGIKKTNDENFIEMNKNNLSTISSKKVLQDELNESESIDIQLKSSHDILRNKDETKLELELRQEIDSEMKYFKLADDKNHFSKQTLKEDDNIYPKQIRVTKISSVSDVNKLNVQNSQKIKQNTTTQNLQVKQQNKRTSVINISSNDQNSQKTFQQTHFKESRPTILSDSTPNLNKDVLNKNQSLFSSQPLFLNTQMIFSNLQTNKTNQNSGQFDFNRNSLQNQIKTRPMTSKHKQNSLSLYTIGLRNNENQKKQIYISSKSPSNSDAFQSQNIEIQGKKINQENTFVINNQGKIISTNRTISFSPNNQGIHLRNPQNINQQNMHINIQSNKNENSNSMRNRKQIKIINTEAQLQNYLNNNQITKNGQDIPYIQIKKKTSLDHTLLLSQSNAEQQYLLKQSNDFQQFGNLLTEETPDNNHQSPDPVATFQKYNKKLIARQFFSPVQNMNNNMPLNQSKQISQKYRRKQQSQIKQQGIFMLNNRDSYDQSISHVNKKTFLKYKQV